MKLARRSLVAFLVGVLLAHAVPVLLALVAAAPGPGTLIRAIKASELPLAPVYFALTTFIPARSTRLSHVMKHERERV